LSAEALAIAEAYDAVPVLTAMGRTVTASDRSRANADTRGLAGQAISVPYAQMTQAEQAAEKGLKAETLLRVAQLLQDRDLTTLSRDDAARIITALIRVDLKNTAQRLTRDILVSWGVGRHFDQLLNQAQGS
jgi:hypothetical protein